MKHLIKLVISIAFLFFLLPASSQEINKKKIYISIFAPYKSNKENVISEKIYTVLSAKLQNMEYEIVKIESQNLKEGLSKSKSEGAFLYVD